jgi:hypothetical protein
VDLTHAFLASTPHPNALQTQNCQKNTNTHSFYWRVRNANTKLHADLQVQGDIPEARILGHFSGNNAARLGGFYIAGPPGVLV